MATDFMREILSMYLYGGEEPPSNLVDEDLIRPGDLETTLTISASIYMATSGGRFAPPSQFEVVKQLFNSANTIAADTYTLTQIVSQLGLTMASASVAIDQKAYADSISDYVERVFLFNNGSFQIENSTNLRFVVDSNGDRSIENIKIIPSEENFDFVAGDDTSSDLNESILPFIDPSSIANTSELIGIGRKVILEFTNDVPAREIYSQSAFEIDAEDVDAATWPETQVLLAGPEFASDLNDFWTSGITRFLDGNYRPILYGTDEANLLSADQIEDIYDVNWISGLGTSYVYNLLSYQQNGVHLIGGAGDDTLEGGEYNDKLYGNNDNDVFAGSEGDDDIYGDAGSDAADYTSVGAFLKILTVPGGGNNYSVDKHYGQTSATGASERDYLYSIEDILGNTANGISIDNAGGILIQGQGMLPPPYNYVPPITYASGNQNLAHTLRGTGEDETLQGGTAADILDGRDGTDTSKGFRGNDLYIYAFTADDDIIDDGGYATDLDTLWFNCDLDFEDLIFERHNADDITITFTGGSGSVLLKNSMSIPIDYIKMRDGTIVDMETVAVVVKGTGSNDYVYGTEDNGANREGSLIHDEMYGFGGVDLMYGYSGTDQIYGGAGNDTLSGGDGGDHLYGEADDDTLNGDAGDDFLYGGTGTNALNGGTGHDTYEGGSGTDTMTDSSNSGNEIYIQSGGNDTVYDWGGADTLRMTGGASIENTTITSSGNNLVVSGGSGQVTITNFNSGNAYKIETIEFSDESWANLTTHASWTKGTSSGETLNGTTGANTVIAYGGNDTVNALGGADQIFLGEGADTGYGGSGADTIDGGPGNDIIEGGDDNDIIIGGPGADNTKGNAGVDTFAFKSMGDAGDTIQDFNAGAGEKLDISDLLTGFNPATDDITDFVQITDNGTNSVISIDVDGGGDNFVSLATIYGTGLTDEQALLNAGNLIAV